MKIPIDSSNNGLHLEPKKGDDDGFLLVETEHPEHFVYIYYKEKKKLAKTLFNIEPGDFKDGR